jgi:predicted glycosyltransferase involved in capsule biosynthesis
MRDLLNTTLIIPVKIEHADRMRNARTTLGFINQHFKTNVFIYEVSDDGVSKLDFIRDLSNLNIKHWCVKSEKAFHRTKYLNIMLDEVETPVVSNYDIDVILNPEVYKYCEDRILNSRVDVIYPYERGPSGQFQVSVNFDYMGFQKSGFDMDFIDSSRNGRLTIYEAECGHCIFFNTETYRELGGENEHFISYGPEDKERMMRFQKLTDNNVEWIRGQKVYHFEHYRSPDSSQMNPHFNRNWRVYESLLRMNAEDLLKHYSDIDYRKKYNNFLIGKKSHEA